MPFEPFADCNECNAPAGDYGCASLALVETKSSIVPLCCECQRKMKDKGKIKVSFVWTNDVCKPCRDRKFAKCGGVFQKRTLSSNCQCGMSLADHNITSHLASQTPQCESRRPSETKPPAAFSGYDWEDVPNAGSDERSTQPTVPPGAQGAWDINSPQRQPDSGKGAITPEKFTDIPDPYNLQLGLEESPPFNGGPGGASQQDQERQQKSMQAEKLLTKVQDRLLKGGTDCDTLAQLAGMLQQERSEKEGLWERYRNLEQQMEATVQHVVNVMGDDKRRLKERIDMLEGGLNQLDADKRNLAQRLGAADAKSGQLASKVTSLTSEGIAAKQRGEKLASHARNAYGFIKQTMEEAEKQASASEHGAQVSSIIRARIVEELAVAGERGKRIDGIADRVDKACEAARVRADDHAELEVHREEAVRRIDALMMEREELLLRQEDLREEVAGMGREAKMAQDEADRVKADLARARGVWEAGRELQREQEGSAAERRADAAERRAMSAESRAKAAEEALGEALAALEMQEKLALLGGCGPPPQQHKVEQHWSVQKGGIKVLRLGSQGSQGQLINSIAGSASMAGTPGPHRDTSNVPAVYQSCPNGVGVGGGQRMGDVWSSGVSSRRDMWPAGGVEELVGAEIGKDEVTKLGEMAEGSFGIVYRGEWEGAGVAVKEMRIPASNLRPEELEEVVSEYRREVTRLCQLRHPNVLSFFGTVTNLPTLGIVTELMDMDMRKYLRSPSSQSEPLCHRMSLARQAFCGVAYLHRRSLVHRDVKPENFLLSGLGASRVCKVCDFGLARVKEATHINTMRTAGTMTYIAPEVHRGEPFDERSDVYSLCIVTWELVTLQTPFANKPMASIPGIVGWGQERPSIATLEDSLGRACYGERARESIMDVVCKGWGQDPGSRFSTQEGVGRLDKCQDELRSEGSGSVRETMEA